MVLKYLNDRAGIINSYDDSILKQYKTQDTNREHCKSSFNGRYMLLQYLCDCHFRERLCQVLPQFNRLLELNKTFSATNVCNHESKGQYFFTW